MPDPFPYPGTGDGTGDDADVRPDRRATASTPRWVPRLWIAIAIILLLLIVALHLTGIIGPGLH